MKTLPPLPPQDYAIPTCLIFNPQLPPSIFLTWLQLYCLTWRGRRSFTFHLQDWADLTGTSRPTFLRHLNFLKQKHALRWHSLGRRMVHVSFAGASFPSVPHPSSDLQASSGPGCGLDADIKALIRFLLGKVESADENGC
jgi:hypothetical protein